MGERERQVGTGKEGVRRLMDIARFLAVMCPREGRRKGGSWSSGVWEMPLVVVWTTEGGGELVAGGSGEGPPV